MSARFVIKISRPPMRKLVIVKDRREPAYLRSFADLRAAMLHIDNRVRAERGMPERPDVTRAEISSEMTRRITRGAVSPHFPRDFDEVPS